MERLHFAASCGLTPEGPAALQHMPRPARDDTANGRANPATLRLARRTTAGVRTHARNATRMLLCAPQPPWCRTMSKRILVVEDQEDLRAILRDVLSASGYTVIEAVDGAEGVAKATSERPDLVLMDIQLPVIDGYDATRQIKALPGLAAIPIIAVSSFAMKGDEEKARAAGCDDYVTKPYSPVQLLRFLRAFLGENA
jgi:two-component system, cell cycle response regulator DivK